MADTTTMERTNIDRHEQGYEAFLQGDREALGELIADGAVWHWPGPSPIGGDHEGRADVLALFGRLAELTGGEMNITDTTFLSTGRTTACQHRVSARRGDRELETGAYEVARWEDGRVVEEWLFVRDRDAWDDFWS